MNDIDKDLMRQYADIVADDKLINESIETGVCEVVQTRLQKTIGMVENLMLELKSDEEFRNTVSALDVLLNTLQQAWSQVDEVINTTITQADIEAEKFERSAPVMPIADPTGTLK